ncbi:MAG: O-antigen ligase family protein [Cyanobacteria bacterium J06606_4]
MGLISTARYNWIRSFGWLGVLLLVVFGLGFSVLLAAKPLYAAGLVIAGAGLFAFLQNFEATVLGILLLRSALDLYSTQSVPAAFAIGVDLLVFIYLGRQWILRRQVHTDPLWWFLFGWVLLQSIWVVMLALEGLGGTPFMAYAAAREWTRLFSLVMVYLLVMQLRDRIAPDRLASFLLLGTVIPITLAFLQASPIPLPGFLQGTATWTEYESNVVRINSTLGYYNSFATFSLLFMVLALWRMQMARRRLGWLLLVGALLYCLLLSKSLTGMVMLVVFCGIYFLPRLRGRGLVGAIAVTMVLFFILSSDLAQSRLAELNQTPLLNPDLSISKAMVLQAADVDEFRNSFNWRLLQWRNLLLQWQQHPLMGYGLNSAKKLSVFNTTSHNDYVRFLVEEGIIGFSLFLLFLMAQVIRLIQILRQSVPDSPQRALAQLVFAYLISMLVGMAAGNVMVHTATLFYLWALVALLGWPWPEKFGERSPLLRSAKHLQTLPSRGSVEPIWNAAQPYGAVPTDLEGNGFGGDRLDVDGSGTYGWAVEPSDDTARPSLRRREAFFERPPDLKGTVAGSWPPEADAFAQMTVGSYRNPGGPQQFLPVESPVDPLTAPPTADVYVYKPVDTYLLGEEAIYSASLPQKQENTSTDS